MRPAALASRRAFTLVELLVVIAVIAILMALLLPTVRAIHGTKDRLAPFASGTRTVRKLSAAGYDATMARYLDIPHTISPAMKRDLFRVIKRELKKR